MKKRILAFTIVLLLVLLVAFSACSKTPSNVAPSKPSGDIPSQEPEQDKEPEPFTGIEIDGGSIRWTDVKEDEKGMAYITYDGTDYVLGLDFLANAMVFNSQASGDLGEDEVFAKWYKWFQTRFYEVQPNIYLGVKKEKYQYYDLVGIDTNPINPWQGWSVLSKWHPAEGDTLQIQDMRYNAPQLWTNSKSSWTALLNGKGLISIDEEGKTNYNQEVVLSHTAQKNNNDNLVVTLRIKEDMHFSDGTNIKAVNYVTKLLVLTALEQTDTADYKNAASIFYETNAVAEKLLGYEEFATGKSKVFSGVKIIDDYTLQLVFNKSYSDYYWAQSLLDLYPYPNDIYLNGASIVNNDGVGFDDGFYQSLFTENYRKTFEERMANPLRATAGDYYVSSFDSDNKVYHLSKAEGSNACSEHIDVATTIYFANPHIKDIQEDESDFGDYFEVETNFSIQFQIVNQLGALKSKAVRKAIGYGVNWTLVREAYNLQESDNYTPFSKSFWAGDASISTSIYDLNIAKNLVVDDGWIYNADGTLYDETIGGTRYKRFASNEVSNIDKILSNSNNTIKTIFAEEENYYLVPLLIKQYVRSSGNFYDTYIQDLSSLNSVGFYVEKMYLSFAQMLDELHNPNSTLGVVHSSMQIYYSIDMRDRFIDEADNALRIVY